jgi:hypothetical protein
MDKEKLKNLEETLKELRVKVLADDDIKNMFLKKYPELNFEEVVDITLLDLLEYAIKNDYDAMALSLHGAKIFFSSVLAELMSEDDEEEVEEDKDDYGRA